MPRKSADKTKSTTTSLISSTEDLNKEFNSPKYNKKMIFAGAVVVLVVVLLYVFKGLFIAATVNGQPIWHLTLVQELEKAGGKKTLDNLVTEDLILQQGQKEKITVSQAEIDTQIKQIEASVTQQGSKLDDLLAQEGLTRQDLQKQIKIQKIAEKILSKDVKVTDKEIQDYYDQNKTSFPEGKTFDDVKAQIKQQLEQQQLNTKITTWVEQLKAKAKINYFIKL